MSKGRPPWSENEGKVVISDGRRFLIKNGQRMWLDEPPPELMVELMTNTLAQGLHDPIA
jgi:hypothetical protein